MHADYAFTVDSRRDLVRLRMSGFFTPDDIPAFLEARHEAHRALTCGPNEHVTLNDIRELKLQSQEIVEAFRTMLGQSEYHARRLAFAVCPGLLRHQVMRALAGREDAHCFESVRMAEAWLFSVAMPQRHAPRAAASF